MKTRVIKFDAGPHTYTDEDNNHYVSVTTYISKFKEKFNSNYWAWKKGREEGKTAKQKLKEWDTLTKLSHDKGNFVHNQLEDGVNEIYGRGGESTGSGAGLTGGTTGHSGMRIYKTPGSIANWSLKDTHPIVFARLLDLLRDGWVLYAEKRIYSYDHLIAGTIDLLAVKNGKCMIIDWKTNKDELQFVAGYYKKINGIKTNIFVQKEQKFFYPIGHLDDCKGNVYALQLSLYARLCELWGLELVGISLCHIQCEWDKLTGKAFNFTYRWYEMPYLRLECDALLAHRKKELKEGTQVSLEVKRKGINFGIK